MSEIIDWAENEIRLACRSENPGYDPEKTDDLDYGCSCYHSALKAYMALMDDGHSGCSWSFTASILEDLIHGRPLTAIRDEDFFDGFPEGVRHPEDTFGYLKKLGLKSDIQCPRMSSLFRKETLDGKVSYVDIDRCVNVNIECPSDRYHSLSEPVDELFPITMPYVPKKKPYEIYEQTFLTDRKNGDFDTKGVIYVRTPEGVRVDIGRYYTTPDDGNGWKEISREEYERLLEKRIDKIHLKVAGHICHIISEYVLGDEDDRFEIPDEMRDRISELCKPFESQELWPLNRYRTLHWLAGDEFTDAGDFEKTLEANRTLTEIRDGISELVERFRKK